MRAKKSLGQNFLINEGIINKIIDVAKISSNDTILEIGPGRGALTTSIASKAGRVICIEKDGELASKLKDELTQSNIEIYEADILEIDLTTLELEKAKYKIVANIPYNITSHLIRKMLYQWPMPKAAFLMIQKEVANRIIAKPPQMNQLAVFSQAKAAVKKEFDVSAGSFRPIPKVDSTFISIVPVDTYIDFQRFEKIVHSGFSQRRKKLTSNLINNLGVDRPYIESVFETIGLDPNIRAENLTLDKWKALSDIIVLND